MRKAVTAAERLREAREELRLSRWLCDMSLAAWSAPSGEGNPPDERSAEPAPATSPWPLWQSSWHHERCRPVVLRA